MTCVGVCSLLECAAGLNLRVELIDALSERLVAEEHFLAGSNELAMLEKQAARWIAQELLGPFTSNSQRQQSLRIVHPTIFIASEGGSTK